MEEPKNNIKYENYASKSFEKKYFETIKSSVFYKCKFIDCNFSYNIHECVFINCHFINCMINGAFNQCIIKTCTFRKSTFGSTALFLSNNMSDIIFGEIEAPKIFFYDSIVKNLNFLNSFNQSKKSDIIEFKFSSVLNFFCDKKEICDNAKFSSCLYIPKDNNVFIISGNLEDDLNITYYFNTNKVYNPTMNNDYCNAEEYSSNLKMIAKAVENEDKDKAFRFNLLADFINRLSYSYRNKGVFNNE